MAMMDFDKEYMCLLVLQKRHLPDQPIEYLVKVRNVATRPDKCYKYKEMWVCDEQLRATSMGTALIDEFETSKVAERGVDAYLSKRRSLTSVHSTPGQQPTSANNTVAAHSTKSQKRHSTDGTVPKKYKRASDNLSSSQRLSKRSDIYTNSTASSVNEQHSALLVSTTYDHLLKNDNSKQEKWSNNIEHKTDVNERLRAPVSQEDLCDDSDSESSESVRYSLADVCEPVDSVKSDVSFPKQRHSNIGHTKKRRKADDECTQLSHNSDSEIQFRINPIQIPAQQTDCLSEVKIDLSPVETMLSTIRTRLIPDDVTDASHAKRLLPFSTLHFKKSEHHSNGDDSSESSSPYSEGRRISIRQTELAYRFKEIVVRKWPGYMQVALMSRTVAKNALNPKVLQELTDALHNARADDCRVLLLTGSGSVFCSGVDLHYLLSATADRRTAARTMADSLREFINALITFPKPVIAAVNGPAVGVGVAILALCDIVYASDKANFSCPYTRLCQTPEGCASYTLPKIMGVAIANELFLCGRKITALQACQAGLLSQVFWPTNMMQEVVPRVQKLATQSAKSMELTKCLVRSADRTQLESINTTECHLLCERWPTAECQQAFQQYISSVHDTV